MCAFVSLFCSTVIIYESSCLNYENIGRHNFQADSQLHVRQYTDIDHTIELLRQQNVATGGRTIQKRTKKKRLLKRKKHRNGYI